MGPEFRKIEIIRVAAQNLEFFQKWTPSARSVFPPNLNLLMGVLTSHL